MRKNFFQYIMIAFLGAILLVGCDKNLDINPRQSLDASQAFASVASTEAAINSVYGRLKASSLYGRDMFAISDALGDQVFSNGRGNRFTSENANLPAAGNNTNHINLWVEAYRTINEANLVLDNMNNVPGVTAAILARWEGELKFLRALMYFDLVKSYTYMPTFVVAAQDKGGVVLTTTGFNNGATAINYFPSRATTAAVYAQIMTDINRSAVVLTNANKGVYFASKLSALALGSRVALYEGSFARADSFATAAIAAGGIGALTSTTNYVSSWRAFTGTESIFEVRFATPQEVIGSIAVTLHGALNNFSSAANLGQTSATANGGFGPLVPNAKFLSELGITTVPAPSSSNLGFGTTTIPVITRSTDVRNQLFELGTLASGGRWIECTKFLGKSGVPGLDNIPVIRWAELYLNRMEARAKMGGAVNEANAWADLNTLRANRIVGFVAPAVPLTGAALVTEILKQRGIEFAYEGQRYWDLKRNGMGIIKVIPAVNLPATDFRFNSRIPLSETDGNVNLVQNFGY